MNIRILIFAFLSFGTSYTCFSQSDSTQYINGLPVNEDDTVQNFPQGDRYPHNHYRKVNASDLPGKLKTALDKNEAFRGWEQSAVYFDDNNDLYYIRVRSGADLKVIGVNKRGKAVNYNVRSSVDDQ
jgi:hypothetical protein